MLKKLRMNLLKVLKLILLVIFNVVIDPFVFVYVMLTSGIKARIFFFIFTGCLITSFFLNRIIFFVLIGIVAALLTLVIINILKESRSSYPPEQNEESSTMKDCVRNMFIFQGLSPDAAKKRYRELQKQYHPDNAGGDAEISQRVNDQYREYCKAQAAKSSK